jgi:hypothetical protein
MHETIKFYVTVRFCAIGKISVKNAKRSNTEGAPNLSVYRVRIVPYRPVSYRTVAYRTVPYRTVPYRTVAYRSVP